MARLLSALGRLTTPLLVLSFPLQAALAQATAEALAVSDTTKERVIPPNAPINLSPDGTWVTYTVRDLSKGQLQPDEQYALFTPKGVSALVVGWDVLITETKSGETKSLGDGKGSSWGPVWSPDGTRLAFYSDRSGTAQLWLWERSTGKLHLASDVIVRPFTPFDLVRWTPNGKEILAKVLPENLSIAEANNLIFKPSEENRNRIDEGQATVRIFSSPQTTTDDSPVLQNISSAIKQDVDNVYLCDLALIDISSGKTRRIARAIKARWYGLSPDSANAAFAVDKGFKSNSRQVQYDLLVASIAGDRSRVVASNIQLSEWGISISWSPDGKLLGYIEGGPQAKGECFIVPMNGGNPRKVTAAPHPDFQGGYRAPLWSADGRGLYFLGSNALWRVSVADGSTSEVAKIPDHQLIEVVSPSGGGRYWSRDNGRSIYLSTRNSETKQVGFYKVDVGTGQYTKLIEENKSYGYSYTTFNTDVSDDTVVYCAQDAQHSSDVWLAGVDFRSPKRLTRINPQFDHYVMGQSQLVEWRSTNGQRLRGTFLLPSNYEKGKRYPLVVWVYGGDSGSDSVNLFGIDHASVFNMQLLATRGYAVLFPDAPLHIGTPMKDLADAVLSAVDKVVELGIADPNRLGVMGWSYGGYSSLALIVQTTRFRAAVMGASTGNLFSMYGQMSSQGASWAIAWAEEGQGRMGGTPWEFRERYIENSPVFYLDKVQTPLLIIHGTADRGFPSFLADETFVDLRRLGKEVMYAKYEGEGHGFTSYANQVDLCSRVIEWFDEHLKKPARTSGVSELHHAHTHC